MSFVEMFRENKGTAGKGNFTFTFGKNSYELKI